MAKRYFPGVMYDAFSGSAGVTKTYDFTIKSIAVGNTGSAAVTVMVGGIAATVAAGQVFDEWVIPTKSFSIVAAGEYTCIVRADG